MLAFDGLNLVTKIAADDQLRVEINDMNGNTLHRWNLDWFKIWPDAQHVPETRLPKSPPGTEIHGTLLMENGDLVFNFEHCGMVRVDWSGKVVWRLPYQTHHSIFRHTDGNLWACGETYRTEVDPRFHHRKPPYYDDTILEISPDGAILHEWSVADLFLNNGLLGLVYLGSTRGSTELPPMTDIFHLNDVEPFPETMEEGFFKHGDILVSLRNINTVFVFNKTTQKIRFVSTGLFIRQHDPDFMDGNRFSVFDNNPIARGKVGQSSRIVIVTAPQGELQVYAPHGSESTFYTAWMGKHQWLPNGNLLITETMEGRAFEMDKHGKIVWEYVNYVAPGRVGIVEEVERLSISDHEYLAKLLSEAENPSDSK